MDLVISVPFYFFQNSEWRMFEQDHKCSGGPGIGVTHSLVSPVPQRGECWNQGLQRGQAAAAL